MSCSSIRWSGLAGACGAILWTLGDALIVGASAAPQDYKLLLVDYAPRISFGALALMLPSSEPRLAAGALVADIAIPLYLVGSWHLYRGVRPAGGWLPIAVFALLPCGNAWSPLGHAGFYYAGMAYKTILITPIAAHDALITLGNQFDAVLRIAWLLPIAALGCGLALLGIAIALGRTAYPRWAALVLNPVALVLIGSLPGLVAPSPVDHWLEGAAFNIGFLAVYGLSTALLWNGGRAGGTAAAA